MVTSVTSALASAATTATTSTSTTSTSNATLASNFQTFLTLLTTQLQNQNPLDPLDTNQFTQQLVQFAQVEQQLKQNEQLTTLIDLQKTAQSTQALGFVGKTVAVDGSTTTLSNGVAAWSLDAKAKGDATITITSSTGQTVFSQNYGIEQGQNTFVWDGKGNDGTQWPTGKYTISVTAKDSSGQASTVSTEVLGTVDSTDLTSNPPMLSVGGNSYTINQIKRVISSG